MKNLQGWTTLPLGERSINLDSKRIPIKGTARKAGRYPYYGASGIIDYVDGFIYQGLHLLVAEDGENLRSRNTPVAFLAGGEFWVNNHAHVLQTNEENDLRFLSYALGAADLTAFVTGSAQPKLTQKALADIPIFAPPLAEQCAIAATLGALDDKIDSNQRMANKSLALLDAYAAQCADALPVTDLGSLVSVAHKTVNLATLGDSTVDHFSLPAFDAGPAPESVPASSIMSNKQVIDRRSILVSRLNPRFNRIWWVTPKAGVPALASTEFLCLTANDDLSLARIWLAVRDEFFREELTRRVTGTSGSHQRVRPEDALAIEVPDTSQADPSVVKLALAQLNLVEARRKESQKLTALRDALLPKLLSGTIRITTGTL